MQANAPEGHTSLLLTAFADAVATCGTDGLEWIVKDKNHDDLPAIWLDEARKYEQGRFVAFKVSD